jgi:YVTN family beta-propeller protein
VSRQTKAALAAIVGLLIGVGAFAAVVLALRDRDDGSSSSIVGTDTGAPTDTGVSVETQTQSELATRTIATGGFPNAVAVGANGVWVVRDGRKLVRIDPSDGRIVVHIGAGDELGSERPCGIDVGQHAVWVVTVSGQVARINPKTNRLARLVQTQGATCVAAGAGGVWVTESESNKVVRVDPATNDIAAEIPLSGRPQGIAVAFGSVWVAASDPPDGTNGGVSRIDPRSNQVVKTILVQNLPEFVVAGTGAIWATSNNGTIAEIDPQTNQLVSTIRITQGGRTTVTAGDGAAWAAEIQTTGEASPVYRIDPDTGKVQQLPASFPAVTPLGMAFGAKALWIADYNGGGVVQYIP